jgi:FAD/FMN-containing dehydrogenase
VSLVSIGVNSEALRRELEAAQVGEVRFDTVSRALYSTDASVYQILPVGVVVPLDRDALVKTFAIAARHGCPVTMRGGGTSQAGQAIGEGLQIDTSKHVCRLLEVNAAERHAEASQPTVRARYFHRKPRDDRRHDGEQLVGRAVGAVWQDD